MKLLKFLMKTIIIFIVLILFFGIFTSIKLKREHQKVTEVWTMFEKSLKQRDSIIVTLSTFENFDSIIFYIEKSILEREKHGKTLDFQFYEYKINEFIMLDSMITSVMINLHKELNFNVYAYNQQARSFNEDYSIFPNILVCKFN